MLINFRCKLSSSLKIQFVVFQCSVYHFTGVTVGDRYSLTNLRPPPKKRSFPVPWKMIYTRWRTWGKWLCYGVILFHFIMQMCVGGKVNRKKMLLSSFLLHKICFHSTPCPPLPLVAYSATPSTMAYRTVRTFQWGRDGWHGDCRLPAHPLVTWGISVSRNRAWCLVTFSILLQKLCICVDIQPYA